MPKDQCRAGFSSWECRLGPSACAFPLQAQSPYTTETAALNAGSRVLWDYSRETWVVCSLEQHCFLWLDELWQNMHFIHSFIHSAIACAPTLHQADFNRDAPVNYTKSLPSWAFHSSGKTNEWMIKYITCTYKTVHVRKTLLGGNCMPSFFKKEVQCPGGAIFSFLLVQKQMKKERSNSIGLTVTRLVFFFNY